MHQTQYCEDSSIKIYQTFSEDDRCKPLRFLPSNVDVKPAVLASFPGSGNTWLRHLLQQASGIYTGSEYSNPHLSKSGNIT